METIEKTTINGFRKEDILATISAIQENPEIAKFRFRAKNKWITAGHNQATVKDFYGGCQEDTSREKAWVIDNGEPPFYWEPMREPTRWNIFFQLCRDV
jgi:hypothetical protein